VSEKGVDIFGSWGWRANIWKQFNYPDAFGAIRRIRFIIWRLWSTSGSRLKSLFMDCTHLRGFGRGLGLCPKIATPPRFARGRAVRRARSYERHDDDVPERVETKGR
jgi:hypothetical protein